MSLLRMTLKVGFRKISLKRVPPSNLSESDYCQIGMTAIVMGDVNAVYTLECAHRRQLLAARALHERSLMIRGLPFPRTKTIGNVHIDDLVILSVLRFSNVHLVSSPIEVQRADALYDFLQVPTSAGKSGSTLSENSGEEGGRSPSLFDEKVSPASMCPTLQPPHSHQAADVV